MKPVSEVDSGWDIRTAPLSIDTSPNPSLVTQVTARPGPAGIGEKTMNRISLKAARRHVFLAFAAMIVAVTGSLSLGAVPASANPPAPTLPYPPSPYLCIQSVSLYVDAYYRPTRTTATLTAVTACDVGPTPDWIQIFDRDTGAKLADCYTGRSCPASVRFDTAGDHNYIAYAAPWSETRPTSSFTAPSNTVNVDWYSIR
ncbi:MAG: hypothetical protein M3083_08305 [Actinomycetota bacterium]|nr:hypothetical protein [Actinomycetota bacterium]